MLVIGYRFNISIYKESIEGYYELSPSAVALINILDADEEQPFLIKVLNFP